MAASGDRPDDRLPFRRWITQPQSIIALAAVLLSVCGLFVALYEAALVRQAQRAAAWPFVEVSASLTARLFEVRVRNAGVGPARVRTAAVVHRGEVLGGWDALRDRAGFTRDTTDYYYSLAGGRVLPRDSADEPVFRVEEGNGAEAPQWIAWLVREAFEGRLDVTVCYCSVYEECWTSSLQVVTQRSRGAVAEASGDREVESCRSAPNSAI